MIAQGIHMLALHVPSTNHILKVARVTLVEWGRCFCWLARSCRPWKFSKSSSRRLGREGDDAYTYRVSTYESDGCALKTGQISLLWYSSTLETFPIHQSNVRRMEANVREWTEFTPGCHDENFRSINGGGLSGGPLDNSDKRLTHAGA